NLFNDQIALYLDGVSARLIERMNRLEIMADLFPVQRAKRHVGGFGKNLLAKASQVNQADAGDDLMRASLQLGDHPFGLVEIRRLAEQTRAEIDQRVGAEHQRVGNLFGNGAGFAIGVELGEFARGQLLVTHLRSVAGHDAKPQSQFAQEFGATRRSRSEDEPWQVHSIIGGWNIGVLEKWS